LPRNPRIAARVLLKRANLSFVLMYVMTDAFKYVLSTMGVSKESISKFLIGNRFHVKLRILSPYSNRMFFKHFKPYSNRSWTFRL